MSDAYCPAASPSNTYLFEHVRAIGAEGIVSKRAGSHIGGASRDWRQTNCRATGRYSQLSLQQAT
jgi:ATP-dependent DNA ligase